MPLEVDVTIERGAFTVHAAFDAQDGETVALLGPNGAGKSTLVEAMAGLIPVTSGTIRVDDAEIQALPAERRPIGIAFQDALLFPRLSVLENVAFPLRARGGRAQTSRAVAAEMLAALAPGVDPGAKPESLSGGQRQRVALARALVAEPRLLLLDEPLAAVDASARPELRALLRQTLSAFDGPRVLVSHDPVESMTLASRIVILEAGQVTQAGTPEEIRNGPRTRYAADLVGVNLFEGTLRPAEDGAGVLETSDGQIVVALPPDLVLRSARSGTFGRLAPADVSIHTTPPVGSPRNIFPGSIEEIAVGGDRARVRLRTSPPLVAEITVGSVDRLHLAPGDDVWATFKAVEVQLMVPTAPPDTLGP
jgi:molybdate transport system ATP-binding protein